MEDKILRELQLIEATVRVGYSARTILVGRIGAMGREDNKKQKNRKGEGSSLRTLLDRGIPNFIPYYLNFLGRVGRIPFLGVVGRLYSRVNVL